ncbi:hypothetical protein P5F65_05665 [Clostridium perfringens]|uniref:hypothetical protein n=1 Tax=Clostridium perfringens TaxID=1502 RepID=UPI0028CBE9E6|nr:hypothetical protein [Clostridium perfringens]MDK0705272.1 hypothetical protein [Clostridium perfringens]MDK0966761.1 hypothetical protein [Clostridium perfringens]MDK0976215.1 hypothetical protein [Clostridium perfringens]MDT7983761.1 hypothetical protein [Clostridium perfringens]MDT8039277.1 hypothetical protein [Clostridium perfringens]
MIFNDYVIQLNEKKVQLDRLESIIENFRKCLKLEGDWEYLAFKYAYSNMIDGSVNNNGAANSVGLCNKTNAYFLKLRSSLIGIDYVEFGEILSELQQNIADEFKEEINKIVLNFKTNYKEIHKFINLKDVDARVEMYDSFIESIRNIIYNYETLKAIIEFVNKMNDNLINNYSNDDLKIRLMSNNNDIDELLENLTIIKSIYTKIQDRIFNENVKLKYDRIESGSLFIILGGAAATFTIMKPMLEFGYKIYSEQFSPMAKINLAEKKVKVRGEYFKLIKEVAEANGKTIKNDEETQKLLFDLEEDISKLYSNNPYILIDDKELGVKELKNKNIPIEFLIEPKDRI